MVLDYIQLHQIRGKERKCGLTRRAEDSNKSLLPDFNEECITHYNEGTHSTTDFKFEEGANGFYGPNDEFYSPSKYEDRHANFYTRSIVTKFPEAGYFMDIKRGTKAEFT